MKAVVAAFNQEKALVGAFSVITNLRMELFQALISIHDRNRSGGGEVMWLHLTAECEVSQYCSTAAWSRHVQTDADTITG